MKKVLINFTLLLLFLIIFHPFHTFLGFDAFGDILQPQKLGGQQNNQNHNTSNLFNQSQQQQQNFQSRPFSNNNLNNNRLSNQSQSSVSNNTQSKPLITGDLDSSLASLAQNLDIVGHKRTFNNKK